MDKIKKERKIAILVYLSCAVLLVVCIWFAAIEANKQEQQNGVTMTEHGYTYTDDDGCIYIVETTTAWTTVPTTQPTVYGEVYKWRQDVPLSQELQGYIWQECKKADIPTSIVYAVIECESNFDENAVSYTGDYGLMQLNEICHAELCERLCVPNVIDPYFNVLAGISLLSDYYNKYDSWNAALMAYNCGQYGAERLFESGVYTTEYADKVLEIEKKY